MQRNATFFQYDWGVESGDFELQIASVIRFSKCPPIIGNELDSSQSLYLYSVCAKG